MDKQKTYLVINEGTSRVVVSTRFESIIVDIGESYPFLIDEIQQINSSSNAFKIGLLFFEPEYQEEIYGELRIRDWQKILHDDDIVEILQHPTDETLQQILDIEDPVYFDRVRSKYVWMKNNRINFPSNVGEIINARYKEFGQGKRKSQIKLSELNAPVDNTISIDAFEQYKADMEKKMAELVALLEQNVSKAVATEEVTVQDTTPAPDPAPKTEAPKKTTTKAKSTGTAAKRTTKES